MRDMARVDTPRLRQRADACVFFFFFFYDVADTTRR